MTAVYFRYNQLRSFVADCQDDIGTTASAGALDFAWNDENCRFTTNTCASSQGIITARTTTGSDSTTWFAFDGDKDQLRHRIVNWTVNTNGAFTAMGELVKQVDKKQAALMEIFEKVPDDILKEMNAYEKKLVKAKEKSEKLLKDVLSPKEYYGLVHKGEIEIKGKEDDIIFIIKKDPNEMIQVKKNGKADPKLCIVAKDPDMQVGDKLLSKILIVKTDYVDYTGEAVNCPNCGKCRWNGR